MASIRQPALLLEAVTSQQHLGVVAKSYTSKLLAVSLGLSVHAIPSERPPGCPCDSMQVHVDIHQVCLTAECARLD